MSTQTTLPDIDARLAQSARDSRLMSEALEFLGDSWRDRPGYAEIAKRAGLSPHHFHRIFVRWTGASPKRIVDAYTHAEARAALEDGASVLDAAYEVGLSGPSRLHDLFIAHEAVTPGDAKRRGAGLSFIWGEAPTPFGIGVFLISPRGLSALAFVDEGEEARGYADLENRYPAADFTRDDAVARDWTVRIFVEGGRAPLALYGTDWQRQVWRALIRIPPGATTSYQSIAEKIGAPTAARAVGAAVGRNPISYLIPCHRVLAQDGRLTGYHWGVNRKRAMLVYEEARAGDAAA